MAKRATHVARKMTDANLYQQLPPYSYDPPPAKDACNDARP